MYLFLIAPVLNEFLKSNKKRIYLLLVLGFISVYMGTIQEPSLKDGKNLPLFMFLYILGDCTRHYWKVLNKIKMVYIIVAYFVLNVCLVIVYNKFSGTIIGRELWLCSFPYCSPLLIINALMLFVLFGRLKIRVKTINYMASSVFAVYIIHHQHFVLSSIIGPISHKLHGILDNPFTLMMSLCVLSIMILFTCIMIDKVFTPFWVILNKKAMIIDERIKGITSI